MSATVQMIGLDFGTTTSAAIVAEGRLTRNAVTGRTDLDGLRERFRSELVFTPFIGDSIDIDGIARQLDAWFDAGGVRTEALFGGGALLTGLTAQRGNADALVALIRKRVGDTLIATANDPCLESWLAFMGSCAELSRSLPARQFINLDIGGGTTNLALGQAGEVLRTGCLFVGARHLQVHPGTYHIVRLSIYAAAMLRHLKIDVQVGGSLTEKDVNAIAEFYFERLDAAVKAQRAYFFEEPVARMHEQVPFDVPPGEDRHITLSGGVGELVYAHLDGKHWPDTTAFGDLGIDLARRLIHSPWIADLRRFRPASAGRATVFGLLRHSTEISGSTLFLPNPSLLPLNGLPILGTISPNTTDDDLIALFALAARNEGGAGVRIIVGSNEAAAVRLLAKRIGTALETVAFPARQTLVLFVQENIGKVLGQYVSKWGTFLMSLIVIDEVPTRDAQFVRIGAMKQQVVPVSFFGLKPMGESS